MVLERLSLNRKKASVRLSAEELSTLINGPWERSISAATDRLSVHMLEAFHYEQAKPEMAGTNYRYVIDQAAEARHLPYVVPSYLRLAELLRREGKLRDAVRVIEQFEGRYKTEKAAAHGPTGAQLDVMAAKKAQLTNSLRFAGTAVMRSA